MFVYCSFAASVDVMLENAQMVFQACLPFFLLFTPWSSIGTLPITDLSILRAGFYPTRTNQNLDFATILWIMNAPSAVQSGCLDLLSKADCTVQPTCFSLQLSGNVGNMCLIIRICHKIRDLSESATVPGLEIRSFQFVFWNRRSVRSLPL